MLLPRVDPVVLVQVLPLLEGLLTRRALVGLLASVHASVALQVRGVLETLLAIGALQGPLPGRITPMLHKLGRGKEAPLTEGTAEGLLRTVRGQLVLLEG